MKHSDEHIEAAVEYLKNKVIHGNAKTGFVTYSELFKAIGLPLPEDIYAEGDSGFANRFLEAVLWYCRDNGLPPLDSLVILKAGDEPSRGYFAAWAKLEPPSKKDPLMFWMEQVKSCFDWGTKAKSRR